MIKIKKILTILLILILSINLVYAEEYPEITKDIEIKYKWYKEITGKTGTYVHKKDILPTDIVNFYNYKFGEFSWWSQEFCNLSREDYNVQETKYITYKKLKDAKYILIENVVYNDNIKIFYNNKEIEFEVISTENNTIKLDLKKTYLNEYLLFFIDTDEEYKISIYRDKNLRTLILSKEIKNNKISIPDESWITNDTKYEEVKTTGIYEDSIFTTKLSEESECRYRDIFVYKYNIEREYYDDNYYSYIDGYIKDTENYKIFYTGKPITNTIVNTIEIPKEVIKEKIIKEPQIKYIYVNQENSIDENLKENDSSQECLPEIKTEVKTEIKKEIVEKEVYKIPKIVYIIITFLIIVIITLCIRQYKRYVD